MICQTGHSRSSFERYGLNVRCGTCPGELSPTRKNRAERLSKLGSSRKRVRQLTTAKPGRSALSDVPTTSARMPYSVSSRGVRRDWSFT